jgi:hypothetical protein
MTTLLYDTGRMPLWARIPLLAFGAFCLVLAADTAGRAAQMFTLLPFQNDPELPHGPTVAVLACFVLGSFFVLVCFARRRWFWEDETRQLINEWRWLFWATRSVIDGASIASVRIYEARVLSSRHWNIKLLDHAGRATSLWAEHSAASATAAARHIARTVNCSVAD